MYEIMIQDEFASAHSLREYQGQCENLHGHNWTVHVFVRGEALNRQGLLIDFREVRAHVKTITEKLDHTSLNDIPPFDRENPTSENIARYIFDALSQKIHPPLSVSKVTVWESTSSCASYFCSES